MNRAGFSRFKLNDPYLCIASDGLHYEIFEMVNIDPSITLSRRSKFEVFDTTEKIIDFFQNRILRNKEFDYSR